MAGDIGINEQVIVVTPQAQSKAQAVTASAQEEGAQVIHRYGSRVLICELASDRTEQVRAATPLAEVAAQAETLPQAAIADLDPVGALGLAAFSLRQSPGYIAAKEMRPHKNEPWDREGLLSPDPPSELHPALSIAPDQAAMAVFGTTSQRMTGSVAVGIIIVSGPTADLQLSADETTKVIAEVQNGLGWLAAQNPAANISWTYDIHSVQVSAVPGSNPDKEALWRDPAMGLLGYTPDWAGVGSYVNAIKSTYGTDWAYVGYFTKYPLDWFAYASIGGPRLVMQYDNDGWGPDNIDRVFAHETGHIFQAPDEYASSGCNCGGSWGWFNMPNTNCQLCAPGGGVDCIMRSNSWAMCHYTPWHFGFPWPDGFPINGVDSTPVAPAAAAFKNKLYVVWKANDLANRLYYSASTDGKSWPKGAKINNVDSTPTSPAACVFKDKLYVFWKASQPPNIHFSASTNGTSWSKGARINNVDSTPAAPAACVFNGKLYVFWKSSDPSNQIYWSASSNGTSWPNGERINKVDSTPVSPAACVFNGKLYIFWKANDFSNRIYFSTSTNGTSWSKGKRINDIDSTPAPLAACVVDNQLVLFWKANDFSNRIYASGSSNGQAWPAGKLINLVDATPTSLASALFQNNPYLFWKANDSSNRIYYTA